MPMEVFEPVERVASETRPVEYEIVPPELSPLSEPDPRPEPVDSSTAEPGEVADPDLTPRRVPPETFRRHARLPFPMRERLDIDPAPPEPTILARTVAPSRTPTAALVPCHPFPSNAPPTYPKRALRRGIEGVVELDVSVDAAGSVAAVRIRSSSGSALLDRTAIETVRAWKFSPATRSGVAVPDVITIPVRFRIDSHGFEGSPT